MELAKLEIENFKGLRDAVFEPGRFGCLVGENNAGKSSVLQAAVYLLNRPPQLPSSVFYDSSSPIIFRGHFSGIDERHLRRLAPEHRVKIEPIIQNGKLVLITEYRAEQKVEIKILKPTPLDPRYTDETIEEALRGMRGNAIRRVFEQQYAEFLPDFPNDANLTDAKAYLRSKIALLPPESFRLAEAPLPSGISSSITALLPEPIYIPAVKNLNDDLKTSQSTSFGRLLGLLLDDMTPDLAQVEQALIDLNRLMNRTVEAGVVIDARHEKVRSLERLVEGLLAESFPRVKIELEVPPPELKAILNTAQIYVDDGSRDLIDHKGDGIKRSLTFALLRAYVQKLEEAARGARAEDTAARPLLFLFEEPELYLHPKSQRILFGALAAISGTYQVVVTTHSPLFFAPGITAVFVRVAKREEVPKPVGVLNPVNFDLDREKAEVFRLARFEHAEAGFFSSRVVLFEGESDDAYLAHVARKLQVEWDFDGRNIALVRVGGKGNFSRFRRFFESFGIEIKIVADLDALTDGFSHLSVSEECIRLRAVALQAVDQRINETGIRPELSARRIRDKVNQESWKARYEAAKAAFLRAETGSPLTADDRSAIEALFVWEWDEARLLAIQRDDIARSAIIPLLDAMYQEGVCVLSRGAIEDYYPANVEQSGPKPQRALTAAAFVTNREEALRLSPALVNGRPTELEELFTELFSVRR